MPGDSSPEGSYAPCKQWLPLAGFAEHGDAITLVERPHSDWSVVRALGLLFLRTDAYDELIAMSQLPELAESWRKLARRRVKRLQTEDWSSRLGL